ncbi:MAG: hypothetical protein WCR54_07865 [Clostridia bacterium]
MRFLGVHKISLDEKNRIRIPSKFRAKLNDDYLLCGGTNNCLFVLNGDDYENLFAESFLDSKLNDEKVQESMRELCTLVQEPEEDSQGRFVLQNDLKDYANISKKVVFIGLVNRIEIWPEEVYDAKWGKIKPSVDKAVKILDA